MVDGLQHVPEILDIPKSKNLGGSQIQIPLGPYATKGIAYFSLLVKGAS